MTTSGSNSTAGPAISWPPACAGKSQLYAWLGSVRVDEITDPDATERAVIDIVCNSELDERVLQSVVDSVLAAHREAEGHHAVVAVGIPRPTTPRRPH